MKLAIVFIAACALFTCANAKIVRKSSEVAAFKRANPCPANGATRGPCLDHLVDHVIPLACNGPDHRSNMQWQTVADARAKDRWERLACQR